MDVAEVKRLREPERENARLKRLVTEREPEIDAMRKLPSKKAVTAQEQHQAAELLCRRGIPTLGRAAACKMLNVW